MHCSEYAPNVCCKFYPICSEKCQCQCALLPVILALKSRYSIHLFEFEKRALTHSPTCEQALKQWKARIKNRFLLINDMNMCAYRMLFSIGFILFHFRFSWVLFFLHFSPSLSLSLCICVSLNDKYIAKLKPDYNANSTVCVCIRIDCTLASSYVYALCVELG